MLSSSSIDSKPTVNDNNQNKLEQLSLTRDEVDRFQKAFSDSTFRSMFQEYMDEISDPVNRQAYEDELIKLESERGNNVTFLKGDGFFVLKLRLSSDCSLEKGAENLPAGSSFIAGGEGDSASGASGVVMKKGSKLFINVATCDKIGVPQMTSKGKGRVDGNGSKGKGGVHCQLPYSIIPIRVDLDKAGQSCLVVDVLFNPVVKAWIAGIAISKQSYDASPYFKLIVDTCFEGVLNAYPFLSIETKDFVIPKLNYKGMVKSAVIREKKQQMPSKKESSKSKAKKEDDEDEGNSSLKFLEKVYSEQMKKQKDQPPKPNTFNQNNNDDSKNNVSKKVEQIDSSSITYQIVERDCVADWSRYLTSKVQPIANFTMPELPLQLIVNFTMPSYVTRLQQIQLDVQEKSIRVSLLSPSSKEESTNTSASELLVKLRYLCLPDSGKASWNAKTRKLVVTLSVNVQQEYQVRYETVLNELNKQQPQHVNDDNEQREADQPLISNDESESPPPQNIETKQEERKIEEKQANSNVNTIVDPEALFGNVFDYCD